MAPMRTHSFSIAVLILFAAAQTAPAIARPDPNDTRLLAMPAITSVIAGATKPEQVRANAAAGAWTPTAAELAELRAF